MSKKTTPPLEQVVAMHIARHRMLDAGKPVLVALSGGADSTALLAVLHRLGYSCVAAHCNFGLRAAESDRDEAHARSLCASMGVPLEVRRFDVAAHQQSTGESLEMACRTLRYLWFGQLRLQLGCQAVAVGHHRDDNVETFLLNALRGTGITGLAGMRPVNDSHVVRPLLTASRQQIVAYLQQLGIAWVDDSTNAVSDVKRNRLRNIVLPAIMQQFPQAAHTLTRTIDHTREAADLYGELLLGARRQLVQGNTISRDRLMRYACAPVLFYELLRPLGFNRQQCDDAFHATQAGKRVTSATHTLAATSQGWEFWPNGEEQPAGQVAVDLEQPNPVLDIRQGTEPFDPRLCNGTTVAAFAPEIARCRLTLRHWRDGDRLAPFGMRGTKLVSDLLAGKKLSAREKGQVWLLEADGEIVWVVGLRASRHHTVQPGAERYWLMTLKN